MSSRFRTPTWIALTLALSGCGGKVAIDGELSKPGDSGGAPEIWNALLMTKMDPNGLCSFHAEQNQPGAVFLFVASQPITCEQPELPGLQCSAETPGQPSLWEICIPIQPELAPKALDFHSYGGYANFASMAPDCGPTVLGFLQQGSLAITAVDPSTVTFTLSGTNDPVINPPPPGNEMAADGEYAALRCP
jgi:hypothetical protein